MGRASAAPWTRSWSVEELGFGERLRLDFIGEITAVVEGGTNQLGWEAKIRPTSDRSPQPFAQTSAGLTTETECMRAASIIRLSYVATPSRSSPSSRAVARWRASRDRSVAGGSWLAVLKVTTLGIISDTVSSACSTAKLLSPRRAPARNASVLRSCEDQQGLWAVNHARIVFVSFSVTTSLRKADVSRYHTVGLSDHLAAHRARRKSASR